MTIEQLETVAAKAAADFGTDIRFARHALRATVAAMAIKQGHDSDAVASYCVAHRVGVAEVGKAYAALGF